jgi:hypothetical protein
MERRHLNRSFVATVTGLILVGACSVASADTARAATAQGAAHAAARAPWQQKLDAALQAAVVSTPDVAQRVVVETTTPAREKAAALAAAGFEVHAGARPGTVVITATGRELMVLAEDPDITSIAHRWQRQ